MSSKTDADDRADESERKLMTSRRAVLGTLASAGIFGAVSGQSGDPASNLSLGGGSMADKVDEFAIRTYQGPLSERPSAGVKDRVWVVEGGAEDGAVYHDDGSSWSKVSRQFESVHTEKVGIGPNAEQAIEYDSELGSLVVIE